VSSGHDAPDAAWARRHELSDLLLSCRSRLARQDPEGHERGLRQQDVADLIGISSRYYASFERGEIGKPGVRLVESVAAALRMNDAQRSALHVLALSQDPPMPARQAGPPGSLPAIPPALRELVRRLDPTPAAITDEMWTILARNAAMTHWVGKYLDRVPPDQQNLILYLFTPEAGQVLADVDGDRRAAVAGLRYQYARNVTSPRFAALVDRLLATGPQARDLWKRHELEIPRKLYRLRIRAGGGPAADVSVVFTALSARLSLLVAMLPEGQPDPV
jgi:transcriptional regulator with XRE-family HTH domain